MSPGFGFGALLAEVEQLAAHELALAPRTLPADLARLAGTFRGRPAQLQARSYAGPRHAYARFVELTGEGLEIANILLVARPHFELPIFGADMVGLGKETAVVVADLSPMSDDPERRAREAALSGRCAAGRLPPEARLELPAWARPWFSEGASCARVSQHESAAACRLVAEMARAFVELSRHAEAAPEQRAQAVAERQQAYSAAHRDDDRGLLLLRRIFEPALAARFISEVLFPQRIPA